MEKLYTPEEVADMLRVTRRTVYEWIRSGQLKAVKVGRQWRITEDDISKMMTR